MPAISVQSIYKIFGAEPKKALKLLKDGKSKEDVQSETGQIVGVCDVSFELEWGELFVIMGLSGSGKSTLLRCINRLVEPTVGKIYIESGGEQKEITSLSTRELRWLRAKEMSMVFQHFALLPYRTVIANVTLGLEVRGMDRAEALAKAKSILELVGLEAWVDAHPSQLSGGMAQRVGLARALATEAKILLMDEPFSALDPLIKVHMQEGLLNLREKVQRTILFVTHDLDEALKIGDRIAIMEAGRIVQVGTPEEIIVNPHTEYVAKFVRHADPSGVLTAGTIAESISYKVNQIANVVFNMEGVDSLFHDAYNNIVYCIDKKGQLLKAVRGGETLPVHRLGEEADDCGHQNGILAVVEDTTLREVMNARLKAPHCSIIVLTNSGRFRGIITEREILRGILEKGRK